MIIEIISSKNSINFRIDQGPLTEGVHSEYSNISNCKTKHGNYWNYLKISKGILKDVLGKEVSEKLASKFQKTFFNINDWPDQGNIRRQFNISKFFENITSNVNHTI